jgi:tetratricopeptide (TPR) repeat protein
MREHASLDRTRRILAVYEVLLGPNSVPARLCRDSYKNEQIEIAKGAKYNAQHPGFPLVSPDPTPAEEVEWQNLKNQAVKAELSKNYAEAARLYELALKEAEKFGSNDTRLAETFERLGTEESLYLGRYDQSEAHLKQSLTIYEKALGKNDTHVWHVLPDLETLYRLAGRKEDLQRIIARRQTMER